MAIGKPLKEICVIGAGAVGGLLAARLAASSREVSITEQGERLRAIQQNGLQTTGPAAVDNLQVRIPAAANGNRRLAGCSHRAGAANRCYHATS